MKINSSERNYLQKLIPNKLLSKLINDKLNFYNFFNYRFSIDFT